MHGYHLLTQVSVGYSLMLGW